MSDYPEYLKSAVDTGADLRVGWRRADPVLQADAKAIWTRLGILPPGVDPEERGGQIVAVAYVGEEVAAVSTAIPRDLPFVRARFAMYRCLVAPEFRLLQLSRLMSVHAYRVLGQWSLEHPEEAVKGMAFVQEASMRNQRLERAVKRGSHGVLAGYTAKGEKLFVAWFEHARV
ncbi:MAG: hypothetical protein ACREEB_04925 [Caulobacteraceae bacterium]